MEVTFSGYSSFFRFHEGMSSLSIYQSFSQRDRDRIYFYKYEVELQAVIGDLHPSCWTPVTCNYC